VREQSKDPVCQDIPVRNFQLRGLALIF